MEFSIQQLHMSAKEIIQTKLVFLGEVAVGKSSIVLRFVKDEFTQNCESTIGGEELNKDHIISRLTQNKKSCLFNCSN